MTPARRADLLARLIAAGEIAGEIAGREYERRHGRGAPTYAEDVALEEQDAAEYELALAYLESRHG